MGELRSGDTLDGKYRITRLLGEGGMGAVYEGENIRIRRRVAIKTLHAAVASNADVVGRFEREATAAGRIGNAHILEVLDLGEMPDGDRYMVMELLEGEPLSNRIEARGRLTPREVAPIAIQVLEGLAAAHAAGITHRDLKPDNVFLLRDHVGIKDYVKIIDFGISKFQPLSGDGEQMAMTRTGAVMGTPYYMSPEQASGSRDADARTDLYALGVILYQAVAGRVPFDAPTFNQLLFKIVLSDSPPVTSFVPDIDPAFATLISKAMARAIDARFQTAAEFKAALEAWSSTGAAVAVPAPPDRLSMERAALSKSAAALPLAAPPPKVDTAGTWSTSGIGTAPRKANTPRIAGLAAAGVLVLVLGSFGLYRALQSEDAEAGAASAADSAAAASPVATSAAPPVVAPAPSPPATAAPPPEVPTPVKEPPPTAEAPKPQTTATPAVTVPRPRAAKPGTAAPKRAPTSAPAPKDDDDFGY